MVKKKSETKLVAWYEAAYTARQVDEYAQRYIRRAMGWSYHARCAGHEAIQIVLGMAFRQSQDYLFPYYRDTATALAAGITPFEIFCNGLSKEADVASGGRHMSNHFAKPEIHIQNVSSCTGNHTLHAVGLARAVKYYEKDAVVFSSQGESSASEGYCFEAIAGACREKLPVVFVIQNNGYGISVPIHEQSVNLCVADNFAGLSNLHIERCDGTDFESSDVSMQRAIAYVKSGKGPAIVHAQCVRMGAHSNSDAHDLYRSKEEIIQAQKHDPVLKLRAFLSEKQAKAIEESVDARLKDAAEKAEAEALPRAESVEDFVTPEPYVPSKAEAFVRAEHANIPAEEKLREAINRTLLEEFARNPDTFMWGQDVASKEKGGVFNLTKGLLAAYGNKRVFNAPIAEDFIVGTANGMCRFKDDIRVVIEAAQFADYVWPAMEQIVETSHDYWRSKGQFCPNIVLRLASGGYIQGGLYHSQNVEAIMGHLPGVRVVYPSCADDAAGLLRTAIRSRGMTFFLEPKYLYNRADAKGPNLGMEFAIEFGKGRVRHEGSDMSIITYGNMVHMALQVAYKLAEEGHRIEVFDLRSIKPIDFDGICATTRKTGKVFILHEDHQFNGIGGEIAALISEHCFTDLDAPIMRLAAKDIPIGFSKILENATLPQLADIEAKARALLAF